MKLSRKLVPAIAMLLVSAVMLSTASFAWFSMNTTVKATGLKVQAQAMGSLVIEKDAVPTATADAKETLDLSGYDLTVLTDCTHVTEDSEWTTFANGLKTIPASGRFSNVSSSTGALTGSVTYGETAAGQHYVEYKMFIAAQGSAMTSTTQKLKMTLTSSLNGEYSAAYAADVYYYVFNRTVADGAYSQTEEEFKTAAAAFTASKANFLKTIHVGDGAQEIHTGAIPVAVGTKAGTEDASGQGAIALVVRVYIDGAYTGSGETPVVNNDSWTSTPVNLAMTFVVAEP